MPSFRTVRRVPFSPRQMFDLVADVETYPQFLPLCEALAVKSRERDGDKEIVVAQMTVGYMAIRETFTSRVVLDLHGPAGGRGGDCRVRPAVRSAACRTAGRSWRWRAAATSISPSTTSSSP